MEEIENVIKQFAKVKECVVQTQTDNAGNTSVAAFLVEKEPFEISELRNFLRAKLPQYMIPNIFKKIEQLPLSPNGKINRNALPKIVVEREDLKNPYIAPVGKIEKTIAGIWTDILEIEKVGVNDNFFDLGGHSFLIIRVHELLQKNLNKKFQLLHLFEYTTVRELAGFLTESSSKSEENEKSSEDWAADRRKALKRRRTTA